MKFPKNFTWGAASASYQLEGAAQEDGRGSSVWDMFSQTPGKTWEGDTGAVACDHYHRYREDVGLMKKIGLDAYRFSIAWPRILPNGTGKINQKGLDFYDRLVDELLKAKIEPWITLFHWDFPYELYLQGGWLNPKSPDWFAEYTKIVIDCLSDRVTYWMTLNEPQCFIWLGHRDGRHAPGDNLGIPEIVIAGHHTLQAHGKSVQIIRTHAKKSPQIGMAPVGLVNYPATNSKADIEAARKATFAINDATLWSNSWWSDPMFLGKYPEDGLKHMGKYLPKGWEKDLSLISEPLDFYGTNIYRGLPYRSGKNGMPEAVKTQPGHPHSLCFWKMTPEVLYWGPKFFYERYGKPIVITENGMSNCDWVMLDGRVHDPQRIDYLHRYLSEYGRAIQDGVPSLGYFLWSIMDNFEWGDGYKQRFGIIHVDYQTQKRTLKDSALWYQKLIKSNGRIV
jgi:beta-glucosidase